MSKIFPAVKWAEFRPDLVRAALLAVVTALLWCAIYDRWTVESWRTPLTYLADPHKCDVISIFAGIKAASEGHVCPFSFNNVPELGAPYIANWDDFPTTEKPILILTGWLARAIGIFAAANVALLLAQMLAAVSFYVATRLLGGHGIGPSLARWFLLLPGMPLPMNCITLRLPITGMCRSAWSWRFG